MENLNHRQRRFVEEYIKNGFKGKQAAIAAGYSIKTAEVKASQLLSLIKVKRALKKKMRKVSRKAEITVEKVLNDLEETRKKAVEHKMFGAACKCSELQGKYLAMFTERFNHRHAGVLGYPLLAGAEERALVILNRFLPKNDQKLMERNQNKKRIR